MINFAENSMKHIHEKFHANHEKIKREILDLLEKAFRDNERYITEELRRHNSTEPQEFVPVHRKIAEIDEDINRLLYGLKGTCALTQAPTIASPSPRLWSRTTPTSSALLRMVSRPLRITISAVWERLSQTAPALNVSGRTSSGFLGSQERHLG